MAAVLIDIANAMFKDRHKWKDLADDDKQKFFFIYNRYFSKRYPEKAQFLNSKSLNAEFDKIHHVSSMDTWFIFMEGKPYPKWFWSKSKVDKPKPDISNEEINFIVTEHGISEEDIKILNKYYPDIIKEEISYYKEIQKTNKKNG